MPFKWLWQWHLCSATREGDVCGVLIVSRTQWYYDVGLLLKCDQNPNLWENILISILSFLSKWIIPCKQLPATLPVLGTFTTEIFSDYEKMNSYFEQSGFYGSHHHQTGAGAHHHDQTAAAAAAYRFPLGLGMSPYASTQHHHHHSLHQSRPPQDSPYDASVAAACKLYSSTNDTQQSSINYSTSKPDCSKSSVESAHQNGYAAVVAAAAKDVSVWQSTTGGAANSASLVGPVRPAACTPDSRVTGYSVGLVGGDPAASPGAAGGGRTSASGASLGGSWNTCSLNSSGSQPTVPSQIHQQPANHTFYPWMAIAGRLWSGQLPTLSFSFPYKMYNTKGSVWKNLVKRRKNKFCRVILRSEL